MRVRIRGPAGQATISISETATVADLKSQIAEKTSVPHFDVKYGYPPQPLPLNDHGPESKLVDIGIKLDGEQLIVSASAAAPSQQKGINGRGPIASQTGSYVPPSEHTADSVAPSSFSFAGVGAAPTSEFTPTKPLSLNRKPKPSDMDAPELPIPSHSSTMILRIMPDDNSCLFRAFSTAFFGTGIDSMHELRSIIAQNIQSNPDTYSAVVLEKEPDDYCKWIQTEDAWGGAIELNILSRHFDVEICSIDVQTLRVDRFNEGRPSRCILVYSGIHYDTIALSPSIEYAPPEFDTKVFSATESILLIGAIELCRILQSKHYYTDTAAFNVRCNVCGTVSVGEKGATEHAKETGHYDFGEA